MALDKTAPGRWMKRALGLARILVLLFLVFSIVSLPRQEALSKPLPRGFGAAIGFGLGGANELDQLGDVWYIDYGYRGAGLGRHQRLLLVEARGDLNSAIVAAREHRGEWWQFGNEPNDPNQDNLSPAEFARRYREFHLALARADPSARVLTGGVADADWKWMDAFRESYRAAFGNYPHVDGWSIHNYMLDHCEDATNVEQFKFRIIAFREWLTRIGASEQPLLLTEYGVLSGNGCCNCPPIPPDQVISFMQATTRWLAQSRLVQGWVWFSVRSGGRFNGDLFSDRADLTPLGKAYRELYEGWIDAIKTP